MVSVNRLYAILVVALLIVSVQGQSESHQENSAMPSTRETAALRGPVRSCTEQSSFLRGSVTDGSFSQFRSEHTTEYDSGGHMVVSRFSNSDGSYWVTRNEYSASGRLLRTGSGIEGKSLTETHYSYDQEGRLQKITTDGRDETPVSFRYDERGRKTKIEISRAEDYRPNTAIGGSPFEAAERAPNLPGGGSATTIYDEQDRPSEVEVRDAGGELVSHAVRTYDAQGHVIEEKLILDNLVSMFSLEAKAKILEEPGFSADQLERELHEQMTKLMGGQSESYSVSYGYDSGGRLIHSSRRIFNQSDEIETTYNEHGDVESEITRSRRSTTENDSTSGGPAYSEVRHSYQYDEYGNWTENAVSHRSSSDTAFQASGLIKRSLMYY